MEGDILKIKTPGGIDEKLTDVYEILFLKIGNRFPETININTSDIRELKLKYILKNKYQKSLEV